MIIHDVEQNSPGWYRLRLGKPTMSELSKIITTTGAPSKSAKKYAMTKAAELITGRDLNDYYNAAMLHGHETEDEAREMYELTTGNVVEKVGFVTDDKERWGCSPDAFLVDKPRGLEIKCPKNVEIHMERLLGPRKIPTDAILQVQGSMFVTGFNEWDYVSYFRGLPLFVVTVCADEKLHKAMETELPAFCDAVEVFMAQIKGEYGYGKADIFSG
jgi:putative phage-type endonuclease